MKPSDRLAVVLQLEQRREDEALVQMRQARQQWDSQIARGEELQRFHGEYQQQLRDASQGRADLIKIQSLQRFIQQLSSGIVQQQQRILYAQHQYERTRQVWLQAHERRLGMARHIDQLRLQEAGARDRAEQKQQDEAAAQGFLRNRSPLA